MQDIINQLEDLIQEMMDWSESSDAECGETPPMQRWVSTFTDLKNELERYV